MNQDPDHLDQSSTARLRRQASARIQDYRSWFAEQPASYLSTTMLLGVAVLAVLYAAIRIVVWIIDWLFLADTPPPPQPPAPAPGPEPAGPLAVATDHIAEHIGNLVLGWSQQHPVGAADPALIPVLWLLAGVVLLVCSRSLIGAPLFAGWAVATVATVYTATAAANPVPAALVAAGLALLWCAWWTFTAVGKAIFR